MYSPESIIRVPVSIVPRENTLLARIGLGTPYQERSVIKRFNPLSPDTHANNGNAQPSPTNGFSAIGKKDTKTIPVNEELEEPKFESQVLPLRLFSDAKIKKTLDNLFPTSENFPAAIDAAVLVVVAAQTYNEILHDPLTIDKTRRDLSNSLFGQVFSTLAKQDSKLTDEHKTIIVEGIIERVLFTSIHSESLLADVQCNGLLTTLLSKSQFLQKRWSGDFDSKNSGAHNAARLKYIQWEWIQDKEVTVFGFDPPIRAAALLERLTKLDPDLLQQSEFKNYYLTFLTKEFAPMLADLFFVDEAHGHQKEAHEKLQRQILDIVINPDSKKSRNITLLDHVLFERAVISSSELFSAYLDSLGNEPDNKRTLNNLLRMVTSSEPGLVYLMSRSDMNWHHIFAIVEKYPRLLENSEFSIFFQKLLTAQFETIESIEALPSEFNQKIKAILIKEAESVEAQSEPQYSPLIAKAVKSSVQAQKGFFRLLLQIEEYGDLDEGHKDRIGN